MSSDAAPADRPDTIERFLAAVEQGDLAAMSELAHPDITMEWPQSGERFRGRENAIAAITATEEKPELAGEPTVIGQGNLWVVRMALRYGPEIFQYAGIFELEDGLVRRTTEYFAAPFPAPEARAPYVER
jgi:SnoaL-like domain